MSDVAARADTVRPRAGVGAVPAAAAVVMFKRIEDWGPVPALLVAATSKSYAVLDASPETVCERLVVVGPNVEKEPEPEGVRSEI